MLCAGLQAGGGFYAYLYLCVVIDLYARKVVSYAVSEYIDENLITEAFESAYKSRACPIHNENAYSF